VWVEIQYTLDEFKEDRAGHQRQVRQAQERVILTQLPQLEVKKSVSY
jgi:putative transposase